MTATILKKLFSTANSKAIALLVTTYFFILGIFYMPFLVGDRCFYYTDTTFFLEPHAKFIASVLKSGQFPLWNPLNYCGMPQIAVTFPSLFYPPDYLLFCLNFSKGLALSMTFHLILAAVGFYLLAKSLRYKSAEALGGSLVFSLSGYMFGLSSNVSLVAGLAWLPISLWALREFENSRVHKFWNFIRTSICVLMLLVSGRPEVIGPAITLMLFYCAISGALRRKHSNEKFLDGTLVWQLRALFLAVTLSLPCLLPVVEWLSMSRRSSGLNDAEVFMYSANWYDLTSMFCGPALGDLRLNNALFRPLVSFANLPPYFSCAFVGPITLFLSVWGIADSRWRWRWLTTAGLAVTLIASLGNSTPLIPILVHQFPALGFVRFPIKLLGFSTLCLGFMTAQGLSSFNSKRVSIRSSMAIWLSVLIFGLTLLGLSATGHLCLQFATNQKPIDLMLNAQSLISFSICFVAGWGMAATLLAHLVSSRKLAGPIGTTLLLGALAGTLIVNAFVSERLGARADFWQIPSFASTAIKTLQQKEKMDPAGRIFNITFERLTPPAAFLGTSQFHAGVNEFQYHRQILKQNNNIDFFIPEAFGFEGTSRGDYYYSGLHSYLESSQSIRPEISPSSDLPLAKFCAITSTSYVISQKYRKIGKVIPVELLNEHLFQLVFEDDAMNLRIYRVLSRLPKCYVTHNWRWVESHNMVLNSIVSPAPTDLNPFSSTILESERNHAQSNCNPTATITQKDDQVTIVSAECDQTLIKVKSHDSGYLVLLDQFYPGWHAYIDSQPSFIYAANGFTRAVEIPAGEHSVEFKYEPESLTLGLILAALGGLLTLYIAITERKQ